MRVGDLCAQVVRVAAVEKDELEPPSPSRGVPPERARNHVRLDRLRPAPRLREAERLVDSVVANVGVAGEKEVARRVLGEMSLEVVGGAALFDDAFPKDLVVTLESFVDHVVERQEVGRARHDQQLTIAGGRALLPIGEHKREGLASRRQSWLDAGDEGLHLAVAAAGVDEAAHLRSCQGPSPRAEAGRALVELHRNFGASRHA
mmetsp:Transcript_33381/g.110403  ORF Transcript_33381/g.110403 Transcript_33381/m.110403 type:complete len:204 (-) Transcript_33381:293-904(-)